eukprot:scaffold77041_cov51-Cyclotella_meneghiniana.AAC.6
MSDLCGDAIRPGGREIRLGATGVADVILLKDEIEEIAWESSDDVLNGCPRGRRSTWHQHADCAGRTWAH